MDGRANLASTLGRIAVLAALALTAVLILSRNGDQYEVSAVFDQTYGLIEGADVRAGGLQVGKVEKIELGDDGYPRVRMKVDDDFRLRQGARARVRPHSVSGTVNRFVELQQGDGDTELAEGTMLGRDRTSSVEEFDQVLSTLNPSTRADVRGLLDGFERATRGRGADIERTLRHGAAALGETADLAAQLNSDGPAIRELVERGRIVVEAIGRDPGSVAGFAERLDGLMRTTAARQLELTATVERMPGGLRAARTAFARLDASVGDLRDLVRDARPGVRELADISPDLSALTGTARPALRELRSLVREGPSDLRAIDRLLTTARPVLSDAVPALRESNPILNELRARLPDAFGFFSLWGDFTANYDANGHGGRVGLVFSNTPTKEIGPSDSGPGRVRLPYLRDPGVLEGEPWTDYRKSFVEADRP